MKDFKQIKLQIEPLTLIKTKNFQASFQTHLKEAKGTKVPVEHILFIKENSSKHTDLPKDKTLFMVNIPVDATLEKFKEFFKSEGIVVNFKVEKLISGCTGHLIFEDSESVQLALKKKTGTWPAENRLEKYFNLIETPDITELKERVDDAMQLFDDEEKEAKRREEERLQQVDEDGFILVGKSTKKTANDGKGGSVQAVRKEDADKLKPKEKGLVDFYRFQKREAKRTELAELKRKFEQDKKKIEQMKAQRKFKPY